MAHGECPVSRLADGALLDSRQLQRRPLERRQAQPAARLAAPRHTPLAPLRPERQCNASEAAVGNNGHRRSYRESLGHQKAAIMMIGEAESDRHLVFLGRHSAISLFFLRVMEVCVS